MSTTKDTAKAQADSNTQQDTSEVVTAKPNAKDQKRLAVAFKANPLLKAVYQTTDGYLFTQKGLAMNHAKTLKDKQVTVLQKGN